MLKECNLLLEVTAKTPKSVFRRKIVLSHFGLGTPSPQDKHSCCNICWNDCKCSKCVELYQDDLDCLQSAFSLKTRLHVVFISSSAIASQDVITTETRWEKMDCWLFCSKQTLYQPRNGVTDWSIAQMLTDHWLVCGEIASNKNSHASQPTANDSEPRGYLRNKTFLYKSFQVT